MSNEELYTLIREYLLGNDSSFNKFYDDTKKKVFANIYSYVKNEVIAEDILSDVYIKFLENINKIKKNESILGLLYVISRNLSLNYIKKNKRIDSIDNYYDLKEESNISLKLECEEVIIKMKHILSDDMFKVIIMRLINELEYKEISKLINKKESTVRWLYMEGIKKVKEELYVR